MNPPSLMDLVQRIYKAAASSVAVDSPVRPLLLSFLDIFRDALLASFILNYGYRGTQ